MERRLLFPRFRPLSFHCLTMRVRLQNKKGTHQWYKLASLIRYKLASAKVDVKYQDPHGKSLLEMMRAIPDCGAVPGRTTRVTF